MPKMDFIRPMSCREENRVSIELDYVNVRLTRDEALYIIEQLEARKEVVDRSEVLDLDDVISKFNPREWRG